ncbi:hypothetical protein [Aeromonas dhakensis]|uniref:hypothetical protein n=1 Tax=Aeromonas dhakensis TaxID=196024 RepID=UPI002365D9E9|nr:hypothetical protein [Aeromonas dhakensis]WDF96105.1 hypothetical protein PUB92_07110 [Aeromonas dhakensis]
MKKAILLSLLSFFSIDSYAHKAVDINFIELQTSNYVKKSIIAEGIGFGMLEFTVQPHMLRSGDGKGIELADSQGEMVSVFIDDDESSVSIWDKTANTYIASNNSFPLTAKGLYRFAVTVKQGNITVDRLSKNGITRVLTVNKLLVPPFTLNLATQRTGASFYNVTYTNI